MKNRKLIIPVVTAAILIALFMSMNSNFELRFEQVTECLSTGESVSLDRTVDVDRLADVLYVNSYVETKNDALFAAEFIAGKLKRDTLPEAVQDFNKRMWHVPVSLIEREGSDGFREKLVQSRALLGWNEETAARYRAGKCPSRVVLKGEGTGTLTGKVLETIPKEEQSLLERLILTDERPMAGTLVRLDGYRVDSIGQGERTVLAYAMTDGEGVVRFEGLEMSGSYSMLPVRCGYEFGGAQGTVGCTLADLDKDETVFTFTARLHAVPLFDKGTVQRMHENQTVLVRTPEAFCMEFQIYICCYFGAWVLLFVLGYVRRGRLDPVMASCLMALTGLSLMFMFGINDPLTEPLLGVETAQGIIIGTVLAALLQMVNVLKFFQNGYRIPFDILERPLNRVLDFFCLPYTKGIGYLCMALLLTAALLCFGHSVGGMKVNLSLLGFVFQPSEITKYLVVVFMAAFFCDQGERIIRYSNVGVRNVRVGAFATFTFFWSKLRTMVVMLFGMGMLLMLYMILGDMGPALVVSLTFIVLYSLIKSRVEMGAVGDTGFYNVVWNCDLLMLMVGIVSFVLFLLVGKVFHCPFFFCVAWFGGWIAWGLKRRQIFESAILFNMVIALFIFSDSALRAIGQEDVARRLGDRKEMCINTWGHLGLEGGVLSPGVNTQVAEGLWGLASGGMTGQGLGNGASQFIPAYHTDMILQSIGEQIGFVGILVVFVLIFQLLYRALRAGYYTNHLFTLYLCVGISVVTAVQFLIIALGSTGFIPLTGITVPLLSYGRVSMILNMMAFGLVLSVTSRCQSDVARCDSIRQYNDILAWACAAYMLLGVFVLGIFFYYQVIARERTLIRPAVAYNTHGAVTVQYNPRIGRLVECMKPGNIYDRNGVLLSTSYADSLVHYKSIYDKYRLDINFHKVQQRFYPFGEHLFFMLGDYNTKLFFSSLDNSPRGLMAEARYLSELRGYDNVLYDESGNKVRVDLVSRQYRPGRFYPARYEYRQDGFQLRDYSALLPYLKSGYNSDRIENYNARTEETGMIRPQDITLSIDAGLQTRLQQELAKVEKAGQKRWHRFQRTSVVVMDASNGELLASANYPLPDEQRLAVEPENYTDNYQPENWQAYTDCDLGLVYSTAPGSSAKVMSALAGLRYVDDTGERIIDSKFTYHVYEKERIHTGKGGDPVGNVNFRQAIIQSSNNYFIHLVNDLDLYDELAYIYASAGIGIGYTSAYKIDYHEYNPSSGWKERVTKVAPMATQGYRNYINQRTKNAKTHRKMVFCDPWWRWAWGQGTLSATPLSMARIVASVANNGKMPITCFRMEGSKPEFVTLSSDKQIGVLQQAMVAEAHKPLRDGSQRFIRYPFLGGKSGTPERVIKYANGSMDQPNDAWYVCYVKNSSGKTSLAIVVRTERSGNAGSGYAKSLLERTVMPVLHSMGYVN